MSIKIGKSYRLTIKPSHSKDTGLSAEVRVVSKTAHILEGVTRGGEFVPDETGPRFTIICRRNDNGLLITAFEDELREIK